MNIATIQKSEDKPPACFFTGFSEAFRVSEGVSFPAFLAKAFMASSFLMI
jgi:hypothetical protein